VGDTLTVVAEVTGIIAKVRCGLAFDFCHQAHNEQNTEDRRKRKSAHRILL